MTTKQNAIDLARTARSEAANTSKRTIAAIISNWNECVKQAGFWCIYDFPTTGYTRKSQLIADLLRCADQLDEYVEPNPHAAQTVEQQNREFNAACTRVLDVEEAHAEALEMDAGYTVKAINAGFNKENAENLGKLESMLHAAMDKMEIDDLHAEALEINEAIDSMIAARQHIANKKPDFSQETWDLVRLGNSYKEAGREWYRWAKATALRLWESRLTQRQLFQMQ